MTIRQLAMALALGAAFSGAAFSLAHGQAVDAARESGRAAAEGTREGVDDAKASVHHGPRKGLDKTKAKIHKAKAHHHKRRAKADAKSVTH